MSDIPTHGPEGWGLCGHPEAQGEPWGPSRDVGEEEHTLDHRGKTLCGYHEMLAEKARAEGACPGGLSPSVLPSRDIGRAVGISCSPCPAQDTWVDRLPARLPAGHSSPFQLEVATQQHESCEIQPCVGTGRT